MDGREFPSQDISEPRWYGYSIGKWEDDTTFVVQTVGLDARTWIDNVGRPHSSDLRVEERFHRVNHDLLELTLTIIDPTMYTKPWNALVKFPCGCNLPISIFGRCSARPQSRRNSTSKLAGPPSPSPKKK